MPKEKTQAHRERTILTPSASPLDRRLPIGAEVQDSGITHMRVWAPRVRQAAVVVSPSAGARRRPKQPMTPAGGGYFEVSIRAAAGARYAFLLDDDPRPYPDPASRSQPDGPHGFSEIVDPDAFPWSDSGWAGLSLAGQVIYELHVGTFTKAGTWAAAAAELPELAETGITSIEMMPVAEFAGQFGWGYDGVDLFAPSHLYGPPDDLRHFVDRAHALGMGVILDVVYNHLGPDGAFLDRFAQEYFAESDNDWGRGFRFDGPSSGPVREFVVSNARYWIDEFHMDGLRLDATQAMPDLSPVHVLAEIARAVRETAAPRSALLVAENEPQESRLMRPASQGGYGLNALWNDDYHHTAIVALTGRREAYYSDYHGTPQELLSAVKWGFLYQGQWYSWQHHPRGTCGLDLAPSSYVLFLENHDQIANSAHGHRTHAIASPGRLRALTVLTLLAPGTPMLFQGQEFAASAPFLYFADHHPELAAKVRDGRRQFLAQFPSCATAATQAQIADPGDLDTFTRCKLDFSERKTHAAAYELHRDLLRLRRAEPVFRAQGAYGFDGAVLGDAALALRFFGPILSERPDRLSPDRDLEGDRLLLVNLGTELRLREVPEPLLAPPTGHLWRVQWSTEDVRYGGGGAPPVEMADHWRLPGESAVLLQPIPIVSIGTAPAL